MELDGDRRGLVIQGLQDLPTLPVVVNKIITIIGDERSSASDLSDIISRDQSILSVVLRLVNSAFYGYSRGVTSVHQATVILGFNILKSIALGASIFKAMPKGGGKYKFDRNALWVHSLGVATTARIMAQKVGYNDAEEAFVSGLLHDVGRVIFDSVFPDDFSNILVKVKEEGISMIDAEMDVMDMSHAEAGKILLNKWQLPSSVSNAAGFHHDPDKAPENYAVLVSIIHLSNIICRTLKIGSSGDDTIPDMERYAMKTAGLTPTIFENVMEKIRSHRESIEKFTLF